MNKEQKALAMLKKAMEKMQDDIYRQKTPYADLTYNELIDTILKEVNESLREIKTILENT